MSTDIIKEENKELAKLININEDACEFYESAQEKAESAPFKNIFGDLERIHNNVIIKLQDHARANGAEIEADETVMGEMRQFWGSLMASVSNDVDETLVAQLEEAEDRCIHSMEDAMKGDKLSATTKSMLQEEMGTLKRTHGYMKALKEQLKAEAA